MITELFLKILTAPIQALLSALPTLDISIPTGVYSWILDIASAVGYILPIKSLMVLFGISLTIRGFQIAWAITIRVKSFIPTMGA